MKITFYENENPQEHFQYIEHFENLNKYINEFKTSTNINKILINLYQAKELIIELDKDFMFIADDFLETFGYDFRILKYKIDEITTYIEESKIIMDHTYTNALKELVDIVFKLVDNNIKNGYLINHLDYQAFTNEYDKDYLAAIKSYEEYIKYMNNNPFLRVKIWKAHNQYLECLYTCRKEVGMDKVIIEAKRNIALYEETKHIIKSRKKKIFAEKCLTKAVPK